MYRVPDEYYFRLHHPRPRFKNDIENVLIFMASEICSIGELESKEFANRLREAIRHYPGNYSKKTKTIDNWRTEISSLLGLVEYTNSGNCKPSGLAKLLDDSQDLIQFFRYFCFKFQYPGGHQKPHEAANLIQAGIKFRPTPYIIKLLKAGQELAPSNFGVSKEEVTHCIFNDLRVTRDNQEAKVTASKILNNRLKKVEYDCSGDIVRYAGDILDYMVLANILSQKANGLYYLKPHEPEMLFSFTESHDYFSGYDHLYSEEKIKASEVKEQNNAWFTYVNQNLNSSMFQADISDLINTVSDAEESDYTVEEFGNSAPEPSQSQIINSVIAHLNSKKENNLKVKTKEIGDVGEAIVIHHEKIRLTGIGRHDLAKKVVKYPESLSAGFDIKSYEGIGELGKFIEVKTTISRSKLSVYRFKMTPNEWGAAETHRDTYFVYRLMISDGRISLFVLKNPVQLYKQDRIQISPRDGVEITYDDRSGEFEEVLV
jgi:hypothetical protein